MISKCACTTGTWLCKVFDYQKGYYSYWKKLLPPSMLVSCCVLQATFKFRLARVPRSQTTMIGFSQTVLNNIASGFITMEIGNPKYLNPNRRPLFLYSSSLSIVKSITSASRAGLTRGQSWYLKVYRVISQPHLLHLVNRVLNSFSGSPG